LSTLHFEKTNPGMSDYLVKFAAGFGVDDIRPTTRMPKTRRALAVAEFARDHGRLGEFRSLTMYAHWTGGKDIEDAAVLRQLAAASGLDPGVAIAAAADPVYLKRVDDMRVEYKQVGVGGIPTFVFGSQAVEGCQPYRILSVVARRAGAKPR
jgi:predicted DsbA family dithiol-disulfide isomerase